MRNRLLTSAVLLVTFVNLAPAADESPARIAGLIAKLASPRYTEREAATRSLDALGEIALEPLRAALRSEDHEVRRRAAQIIETIELRLANERLLKPSTIALEFHNSPLPEAVAALKRHTGLEIHLSDLAARRNVTVSSKPLPVWEAIELFCRKADLREWDGYGNMPPGFNAAQQQVQQQQFIGPGQVIIVNRARNATRVPGTDGRVMLHDGASPTTLSSHAGSVRVRLLPAGSAFPSTQADRDEVVLPLHISTEARMTNVIALSATVERAVNERGQSLAAADLKPDTTNEAEILLFNGQLVPTIGRGRGTQIAIRVQQSEMPSQRLADLRGHLVVDSVVSDVVATADARGPAGTAFSSPCGVTGKIETVESTASGLKFTLDLDSPPAVALATGPGDPQLQQMGGGIVRRGVNFIEQVDSPALPPGTLQFAALSLEDAKGRRLEVVGGSWKRTALNGIGGKYQMAVTFRHREGEAARLVVHGRRPVTVLVPFAFKDVPLQ